MAAPVKQNRRRQGAVVALGASAGGLDALGRVLAGLPADFQAPILVVLHLDPTHRSHAVALLQVRTKLRVRQARQGVRPRAGTVYLAPPDHHLQLHAGRLQLTRSPRVNFSRPSIDLLFTSLAQERGANAIVAVLSGAGADGARGLAAVKAQGGLAVAEDAATATFPGMPAAAARTGLLDAVLGIHQIPPFLLRAVAQRISVSPGHWQQTLDLLEQRTGTRFAKYRASTLQRRLVQRLTARGCRTMAEYLRLLRQDPAEVVRLQAAFLIKVSGFTRDAASWRALARAVRPLADGPRRPVRVWSAGCATGEEAYSLALLLARLLGTGRDATWKVFGTDLDEGALRVARTGRYGADQAATIPPADLERYFERDGAGWRVGKALRSRVVFGRHDLLHDAPLSGMDVLACRNVLIYFQPAEKQRLLARLMDSVAPGGILFLGRSEAPARLPGFDRVGSTTFFRRRPLGPGMAGNGAADGKGPGRAPARPAKRTRRQRAEGGRDARFVAQQDLNEELQSRNEELETVNEELQSLNDEMSAMEEQMRALADEARRTNDFLRLLLDTSPDALVACDASDRVTFWNKAAIKLYRLSPAQALTGDLFDLVPALGTPAVRAAVRAARDAKGPARRTVREDDVEYQVERLPAGPGKRPGYLLRVRRLD